MIIFLPIFIPLFFAALVLIFGRKFPQANSVLSSLGVLGAGVAAACLFGREIVFEYTWGGFFPLTFGVAAVNYLFIIGILLFAVTTLIFMLTNGGRKNFVYHFAFLFTIAMACGAVIARNMTAVLFFWEALLIPLYLFLAYTQTAAAKETAYRAFIINAVGDVLLLAGFVMFKGSAAFTLIVLGAMAKAGAVPFQSWLPMAADSAKTSFMAFLPGALEKLLAVYLLCVAGLMFPSTVYTHSLLLGLGGVSIIYGAIKMFNEKDFKRFIAYNVIMQIGLFAFEMGLSAGIDFLYMANHAVYKAAALSALFFIAYLPRTRFNAFAFVVCALTLCKLSFGDVFFSANFYGAALSDWGSVTFLALTNILVILSFIKIFVENFVKKEAGPLSVPVIILVILMLAYHFGWQWNEAHIFNLSHAHFHFGWVFALSLVMAGLSCAAYYFIPKDKLALPVFKRADTYLFFNKTGLTLSKMLFAVDRTFDFLIDDMPAAVAKGISKKSSVFHTGYTADYIIWAVIGAALFGVLALTGGFF